MMTSGRWETSRLGSCAHKRYAENPRRLMLFFMRSLFLSTGISIRLWVWELSARSEWFAPRFRWGAFPFALTGHSRGRNRKFPHNGPSSWRYPTDVELPLRRNVRREYRETNRLQWNGPISASECCQSASGWRHARGPPGGTKLSAPECRHPRTRLPAARVGHRPPSARRNPAVRRPQESEVNPPRPSPIPRSGGIGLPGRRDHAAVRAARRLRPRVRAAESDISSFESELASASGLPAAHRSLLCFPDREEHVRRPARS